MAQKSISQGSVVAIAGSDGVWYMLTTQECMAHESTVVGKWLKTNCTPSHRLTIDESLPEDMTMRSNMLCIMDYNLIRIPQKLPQCRDVPLELMDKAMLLHEQFLLPPPLLYPEPQSQHHCQPLSGKSCNAHIM